MKILFIGAGGFIGEPVAQKLLENNFDVTLFARNKASLIDKFPNANIVEGDLQNYDSLKKAIAGHDTVYMSLSVKQDEKEGDFHAEGEGLSNVLKAAAASNVKRIAYLASIVQDYQGKNGFDWWVFKLKNKAIEQIKASGINYTIYYPSSFMDTVFSQGIRGTKVGLMGKSIAPNWCVSRADFATQVVKSLQLSHNENKEYYIQGSEPFTQKEMAEVFVNNYSKQKLSVQQLPLFILKVVGFFDQKANYGYHILQALNNNPEQFMAQKTWDELGKPAITMKGYALSLN